MKHIKLRILGTIWVAMIVIFALFMALVNILIPSHYEKEAKLALENEMEYIDKSAQGEADENEYEDKFLSGNIRFIDFFNEGYTSNDSNPVYQSAEKEIRQAFSINDLKDGDIKTLVTEKGYYVLVKYKDAFSLDGRYQSTVMYINIEPVVDYTRSLSWIFAVAFAAVIAVTSVIGYRLGKQIEDAYEANHVFFQNSSHELKTPLMAIQGYADGIQAGIVDIPSSAETIMSESEKMAHMIDGMLSISKIDSHQLVLHLTTADVHEILYDSMRSIESVQRQKGITVTPQFSDSPVWIRCDETQLSRVFTNVIINGIRYCKKEIVISCTADKKEAVIKIKDDGFGINAEDLPHLFDRFYSGSNGNTGIGLALSKEIVNLHNGSITAYNEGGAVFEIRIPLP